MTRGRIRFAGIWAIALLMASFTAVPAGAQTLPVATGSGEKGSAGTSPRHGVEPKHITPLLATIPSAVPVNDRNASLKLVEFRELPLNEVLRLLAEHTGLRAVASAEAGRKVVSAYLRDVEPLAALDAITRANGMVYRTDPESNILRVYTIREFEFDIATIREDRIEVFTLLYPNALDVALAVSNLLGNRVQLNLGNEVDDEIFDDLTQRFDRFDLVDGRSQGLGFFEGNGSTGGFSGNTFGGTGGFSGTNSSGGGRGAVGSRGGSNTTFGSGGRRSDLTRDARVGRQSNATQIDTYGDQPLQNVSPELAQALEQSRGGQISPAIERALAQRRPASIFVSVVRRNNQLIMRTTDDSAMDQIRQLVTQLDVPTPMVLLEVKILRLQLDDTFSSVFDYQFQGGNAAGGFTPGFPNTTAGNILPPLTEGSRFGSIVPLGSGINPQAMIFQYVDAGFRFRMQLLEQKNRVTTLATPMLMTANNEVSRVFVGREVPINRSFTGPQPIATDRVLTGAAYSAGSTGIEFRPVGTTLLITPNINADCTVTLRLLQEESRVLNNNAEILVPTNTGFEQQLVDVVDSTTVSGTFVAKDGLTLAIGGLIQEDVRDARVQVPVLGRLPVLGFFFRSQQTIRARNEVVILIRPYVVNTPSEAQCASGKVLMENSMHPKSPDAIGQLGTHKPWEVARPVPPDNNCKGRFRVHTVEPKDY